MELLKSLLDNNLYTKITIIISLMIFIIIVIIIIAMSKSKNKNENSSKNEENVYKNDNNIEMKKVETNNLTVKGIEEVNENNEVKQIETQQVQQTQTQQINSTEILNNINENIDKYLKNTENSLKTNNIYKFISNNTNSSDGSSDLSNTKIHILSIIYLNTRLLYNC